MAADPTTLSTARNAEELRERLQAVSQELHRTQREIQQDAAGLERLRSMLDVGYWNDLVAIVNQLEAKVREATEMSQQAEALRAEDKRRLDEEQRRLEKLWDAFKLQEREVLTERERAGRLDRELQDKDSSRARLEADVEEKADQLRRVEEDNRLYQSKVEELEGRLAQLKDLEEMRSQAEDYRAKYEAERERLAKLYAVYEESEAERDRLKKELEVTDQWFEENKESLEKISRSLRWRASMLKRKTA